MIVRLGRFGQLEPGPSSAAIPEVVPIPGITLGKLFTMSVLAGVTVWLITKMLERR